MRLGIILIIVPCIILASLPAGPREKKSATDLNNQGIVELDKGRYREAIGYLFQAYQLDPESENVRKNLATAYNNYGTSLIDSDIDRGIRILQQALKYHPDNSNIKNNLASAYNQKAVALMEKKSYSGAESYLLTAIRYSPRDKVLRQNLSAIYTQQGTMYLNAKRFKEALSKFNNALSFDKDNAYAYLYAGDIYYQNQQLSNALWCFRYAWKLNPEFTFLGKKIETLIKEQKVEGKLAQARHRIFDIRYDNQNKSRDMRNLLFMLEDAYTNVGMVLNYNPNHKVVVLLYPKDEFQKIRSTPHWVGGLYDGKIRLPYSENLFDEKQLGPLIRHEYTHALVHDLTGDKCSIWLNEGLAKFMEHFDDMKKFRTDELKAAFKKNKLISLANLERGFVKIKDERRAALAYQQSLSIVQYIYEYYGFWKVRRMLESYAKGNNTAQMIRVEFNQSVPDFERWWRTYLDQKF